MFLACGAACLQRHVACVHDGAGGSRARALDFQRQVNQLGASARTLYAAHRARLMRLLSAAQRTTGVCVLGAGNGNDLDLPVLIRLFGEVHLVDIDGAALERAVADLPGHLRARVVLHAGVDLSGCLENLDAWGDRLPDEATLQHFASATAADLARAIGRSFDVVLSACVLSQLGHPLRNTLALEGRDWQRLLGAITRLHLATVTLLTRIGGTGVIACDVLCQAGAAVDKLRRHAKAERLGEELIRAIETGRIVPDPDPRALARDLEGGVFAELIDRVFITEPWLWELGPTSQVVYGVLFRRA
jgi:hypothetical protein